VVVVVVVLYGTHHTGRGVSGKEKKNYKIKTVLTKCEK
jgi:hypothetical protein